MKFRIYFHFSNVSPIFVFGEKLNDLGEAANTKKFSHYAHIEHNVPINVSFITTQCTRKVAKETCWKTNPIVKENYWSCLNVMDMWKCNIIEGEFGPEKEVLSILIVDCCSTTVTGNTSFTHNALRKRRVQTNRQTRWLTMMNL